jgi:hypothetical protein
MLLLLDRFVMVLARLLKALKEKQSEWSQDDPIAQLVKHRSIAGTLGDFLRRCEDVSSPHYGQEPSLNKSRPARILATLDSGSRSC